MNRYVSKTDHDCLSKNLRDVIESNKILNDKVIKKIYQENNNILANVLG